MCMLACPLGLLLAGIKREALSMLYIGNDVQDRMVLLGLTADEVADKAFMEKDQIDAIIQNQIALEEIDEFDLSLICSVLHCTPEFFQDTDTKRKDLLVASMNRGSDNEISMNIKAKIQDFMRDFTFVEEIFSEMKEVHL